MGPNCHTPRSYRGGCANTRDAWHGGRPGRSWDETPGYGPYSGAWKSHTKTDPAAAAIRHTRCVQALTAIGICTDSSVIDVSGPGAQEKQIAKVKCRRDAACEFIVCGHDRKNDTHRTGPAEILAARFADTLTRRDLETVRENCRADGRLQPVPMSMWASSRPRTTVRGKRPAPCPPVGKVSATPRHKTQAAVRNAGRVSTSLSRVPAVASMGFQNCNCPLPPPRSVRAFQSGMVGFRLASQNRDRIYVQGRQHKTRLSARGIS